MKTDTRWNTYVFKLKAMFLTIDSPIVSHSSETQMILLSNTEWYVALLLIYGIYGCLVGWNGIKEVKNWVAAHLWSIHLPTSLRKLSNSLISRGMLTLSMGVMGILLRWLWKKRLGAESTLILASGMCVSTVMMLVLVPAGGHIITTTDCYRKTRIFIETFLSKMGITPVFGSLLEDGNGSQSPFLSAAN